jgi:hypothetical protein
VRHVVVGGARAQPARARRQASKTFLKSVLAGFQWLRTTSTSMGTSPSWCTSHHAEIMKRYGTAMMARSAAASSAVSSLYGALIGAEGNRTAFHAVDRGSARGPARRRVALRSLKACRLNHLWRGWVAGRAKMFLAFTRPQHPTGPTTMLFPRPSRHRRNSDVSRFGRVELVPSRRLCRRQRGIPPFPSNAQTAGASGDASLYEALTLIGSDRLAGPASARTNVLRGYSAPYVPAPPPCFSRRTHSPRVWEATRPFQPPRMPSQPRQARRRRRHAGTNARTGGPRDDRPQFPQWAVQATASCRRLQHRRALPASAFAFACNAVCSF